MITDSQETQQMRIRFYNTLDEKNRRIQAAMESLQLGYGGISAIGRLLGCSRTTIYRGIKELRSAADDPLRNGRIRHSGGGRKPYDQTHTRIDSAFLDVVKYHMAGDPMDDSVLWTNLTHAAIAQRLREDHGIGVSSTVVSQLLKKHGFTRRKAVKKKR